MAARAAILAAASVAALALLYGDRDAGGRPRATLERDGYVELDGLGDRFDALRHLPDGYAFLDYRYEIRGCTLATFHRDVTSSRHVHGTSRPTYTLIVYEPGPEHTLSVCPGSHRTVPFLFSRPVSLRSRAVLFDCDLVHAGALSGGGAGRRAVQYKIAHADDAGALAHLVGVDAAKDGGCGGPRIADHVYRRLSLVFSLPVNHLLTPLLQSEHSPLLCRLFGESRCFYNRPPRGRPQPCAS